MNNAPGHSANRSVGLLGLINVLTMFLGAFQAFVIGRLFGTDLDIEIYFAASACYQALAKIMQTGQVSEIVTPQYHRLVKRHGFESGIKLFSVLINWMSLIACILVALVSLCSGWLVPLVMPGYGGQAAATAVSMFIWIVPLVAFHVIRALLSNFLNAEKKFVPQELCRFAGLAVSVMVIIGLANWLGAWAMVIGLWANSMVSSASMLVVAFRSGYRHSLAFADSRFSLVHLFHALPTVGLYVLTTQLYAVALMAALTLLPQGTVAIVGYAQRIASVFDRVITRPVSIVFFNHYSDEVAKESERSNALIEQSMKVGLISGMLATCGIFSVATPMLKLMWMSERFPIDDVYATLFVMSVLCLVRVVTLPATIYRRINVVQGRIKSQYRLFVIVQLVSLLLCLFVIPKFGLSAAVATLVFNGLAMMAVAALLLRIYLPYALYYYPTRLILQCLCIITAALLPVVVLQTHWKDLESRGANCVLGMASIVLATSLVVLTAYLLRATDVVRVIEASTRLVLPRSISRG